MKERVNMRHAYGMSHLNPFECSICKRDIKAHGNKASCETCDNVGVCELVDNVLMCIVCEEKHLQARKELVENVNIPASEDAIKSQALSALPSLSQPTQAQLDKLTADSQELLRRAREIDQNVRYAGDFFNAETIAITDLREAINGNSLIPDDKKGSELQLAIMQRIIHFQEVIFKADSDKFEALQRIASGKVTLREFGNDILKEIRANLEKNDATYVVSKPVKPKVASKKTKKDPYEMLVDSLMSMHNCSRNEALKMMVDHNLLNRTKSDA